jgi:hypothetical protein
MPRFVAVDLRLAFVVQITRAIKLGDEVFLDYGDKYFEDQSGVSALVGTAKGRVLRRLNQRLKAKIQRGIKTDTF